MGGRGEGHLGVVGALGCFVRAEFLGDAHEAPRSAQAVPHERAVLGELPKSIEDDETVADLYRVVDAVGRTDLPQRRPADRAPQADVQVSIGQARENPHAGQPRQSAAVAVLNFRSATGRDQGASSSRRSIRNARSTEFSVSRIASW